VHHEKIFENPDYRISCDRKLAFPSMLPVEQFFESRDVGPVEEAVRQSLADVSPFLPPLKGKRVALTAGSRGVKNIVTILGTLAAWLKERGAAPFVVPAMGSHGGATAEGQIAVLRGYGIVEDAIGMPVVSSMETVEIGRLDDGTPVFCDRNAFEADYLVPVGRIKPHPDFKAAVESGLCKMMAIGLGKHNGAKTLHRLGFERMSRTIEAAARVCIGSGRVPFGLAILENAYSRTMRMEAIPSDRIVDREKALLAEAKNAMPRLHFSAIDILIVDMAGKDISGAGMDPNITGRPVTGQPGFSAPPIQNIAVLDLSDHSNGNAVGIGMADVVTARLARKIDFGATYTNSITAAGLVGSRLPLVAKDDLDAVLVAYCACHRVTPETVRIVHIQNTSAISLVEASANMREEIESHPAMRVAGVPEPLEFVDGCLRSRFR
jgi:hypothetical protein